MNILTVEQAADLLHCNVDTVRRLAAAGKIPAMKPARRWLIEETQLEKYMRGEWQPTEERPAAPGGLDSQYAVSLFERAPSPQTAIRRKNSKPPFGLATGAKRS